MASHPSNFLSQNFGVILDYSHYIMFHTQCISKSSWFHIQNILLIKPLFFISTAMVPIYATTISLVILSFLIWTIEVILSSQVFHGFYLSLKKKKSNFLFWSRKPFMIQLAAACLQPHLLLQVPSLSGHAHQLSVPWSCWMHSWLSLKPTVPLATTLYTLIISACQVPFVLLKSWKKNKVLGISTEPKEHFGFSWSPHPVVNVSWHSSPKRLWSCICLMSFFHKNGH